VSRRKGEIRIRDYAFPGEDMRHKGCGPDAPKVIRKLLKHHGPLDADSRRESGMSESSVDSEVSSRRSSGFGSWGAFRWASKLSGAWRLGGNGSGNGNGNRSSGAGGYTPSQQDFERNFDGTADVDVVDSPVEDDEYSSDYEDEVEAEPEELLPGLYRALYDFDPEGTAEMGLKEGQTVRVVGRGGGVGWAIAVRGGGTDADEGEGENNWALVPESYLRVIKLDEPDTENEVGQPPSLDDGGDQS
jgi:Variant SH3 domain